MAREEMIKTFLGLLPKATSTTKGEHPRAAECVYIAMYAIVHILFLVWVIHQAISFMPKGLIKAYKEHY